MRIRLNIILLITIFILVCACNKNDSSDDNKSEVTLDFKINTASINDSNSINLDNSFSSLAIYLFNNNVDFSLDKFVLLPSFSSVNSMDIPITSKEGEKILYLIANYEGKSFELKDGTPITLDENTTKGQLESLVVKNINEFESNSLVMVGKQNITISDINNESSFNIILQRLVARIDLHIFKGEGFEANTVILESVTLRNQTTNSLLEFDYSTENLIMPSSVVFDSQTEISSATLLPYNSSITISPQNSNISFYSYQNIVSSISSHTTSAPYLEIKVKSNNISSVYKGYITDESQNINKYSLLRNNVYQITAILDNDMSIVQNITVLPWDKTNIEYERPITSNDFEFGVWNNSWGAENGKTVYSNSGHFEDAVFEFELKAPFGAKWTATLTNGLDFHFTSTTSNAISEAVSKGYTREGEPYIIAVRAAKKWQGNMRKTELYITVEGKEIVINPDLGNGRKYAGSDTRIEIKQVASNN